MPSAAAADLHGTEPAALSWRHPKFTDLEAWRAEAVAKTRELLLTPEMPWKPEAKVERRFEYDGLAMEELSWQLPYGPRTRALFMKPVNATGRLPGVLALHDAVGFASRRPAQHEDVFQKSLLCAGTLWAGLVVYDDQRALDYLASRADVDADRLACGGLSGGGVRTVFLGGLDRRVQAAFPVGWMTTWRDLMLSAPHNHTWMPYVPGLANHLDYPEVLGLRVPLATFVLNDADDKLFTLKGMQAADAVLGEVCAKAGAADKYRCTFYPGPHKFDLQMQEDAFSWLDGILKRPETSPTNE